MGLWESGWSTEQGRASGAGAGRSRGVRRGEEGRKGEKKALASGSGLAAAEASARTSGVQPTRRARLSVKGRARGRVGTWGCEHWAVAVRAVSGEEAGRLG